MAIDLGWAQSLGTTSSYEIGRGIAVDGTSAFVLNDRYVAAADGTYGHIVLTQFDAATGAPGWELDFGRGAAYGVTMSGGKLYVVGGRNGVFVTTLNTDGTTDASDWTRLISGSGYATGYAVSSGADGLYVGGVFTTSIDLGSGYILSSAASSRFVVKLDQTTGDTLGASQVGSTSTGVFGLQNAGGSVYAAAGNTAVKLSADLVSEQRRWTWSGDVLASSLAIDGGNNVLIGGAFSGAVDFDPGNGTVSRTSVKCPKGPLACTGYTRDAFTLKLSSAGNLQWVNTVGGQGYDVVSRLAVDSRDYVYATGSFQDKADFDPGKGQFTLDSQPNGGRRKDGFVSIVDPTGKFDYAAALGGDGVDRINGGDSGYGIAIDSALSVYVTGLFSGTGDFNPTNGTATLSSAGGDDAFVVKLTQPGIAAPMQQTASPELVAAALATADTTQSRGKRSSLDVDLDGESLDDELLALLAGG